MDALSETRNGAKVLFAPVGESLPAPGCRSVSDAMFVVKRMQEPMGR